MAASLRHGFFKIRPVVTTITVPSNSYATKAEKKKGIDRKVGPKIDSTAQSLAAKGFLRSQKEYFPPEDLHSKIENIFKSVTGCIEDNRELGDINQRFTLFKACSDEFGHIIPNSMLHTMEKLGDVRQFYNTPVYTKTPLDKLRNMELPENLHIQFEYHRFHPDTDQMFGGQTAFNESSTLVTGLKYKDKYPGHIQKQNS